MEKTLTRKVYLELIRAFPDTETKTVDEETGVIYMPYSYRRFKNSRIGKAIAEVEAEEKRYNRDR